MSFFSWFTGGSKQVDKITDAVINTGDALFYTDEEKSKTAERQRELYFKFLELSRDENSIKSITRRILAFAVIGQWLFLINVSLLFFGIGVFAEDPQPYKEFSAFAWNIIVEMFWFVFAVGSFYFGANIVNGVRNKLKKD